MPTTPTSSSSPLFSYTPRTTKLQALRPFKQYNFSNEAPLPKKLSEIRDKITKILNNHDIYPSYTQYLKDVLEDITSKINSRIYPNDSGEQEQLSDCKDFLQKCHERVGHDLYGTVFSSSKLFDNTEVVRIFDEVFGKVEEP